MYDDWMANTPIFGEIKNICIDEVKKMWLDWLENVPLEIECPYCGRKN